MYLKICMCIKIKKKMNKNYKIRKQENYVKGKLIFVHKKERKNHAIVGINISFIIICVYMWSKLKGKIIIMKTFLCIMYAILLHAFHFKRVCIYLRNISIYKTKIDYKTYLKNNRTIWSYILDLLTSSSWKYSQINLI